MFILAVFYLLVAVAAALFSFSFSFSAVAGIATVTAGSISFLYVAFFWVTVFFGLRDPRL